MKDIYEESLELHRKNRGKIGIAAKVPLKNRHDLSLAYTPGVAAPCRAIAKNPEESWNLTSRGSWVAVITDGSAVLGLGDIGSAAGMPVMEGKCVIFKEFAGLDAFPFALKTRDTEVFIETVKQISLSFGAVNLEDIAAPRCFEIEERLQKELDIPVMHDDQHGTAIVTAAALMNAAKITGRTLESLTVTVVGAGAAGTAVARLLSSFGVKNILMVDRKGIISPSRTDLTEHKKSLLTYTNRSGVSGSLADSLKGRDVMIGVSGPDIVTADMIRGMANNPIVFGLSNPQPEIMPDEAKKAGAAIVATGRSDFPNQINNALSYPGVFKGVLEMRAPQITEAMKQAAARALAEYVKNPSAEHIIPDILDKNVVRVVADAVKTA
jgi:malate dehydrogenase (oxaloacetate-decarboxylating)